MSRSGRERVPLLGGLLVVALALNVVIASQLRAAQPELRLASGALIVLLISALAIVWREARKSRLRVRLLATLSHELRTPLAQIRMFAETLRLGRVRSLAEQRRSLEIIGKEAQRMTQLVDNVMQVARSRAGRVSIQPSVQRLGDVVRESAESFVQLADTQSLQLRFDIQADIVANVDASAVRQILLNLLDNARKYGPPRQWIAIGLALHGDVARLWVQDEGAGIPEHEREAVFDPFYRSANTSAAAPGTGIGLAVVRELAQLHGGRAYVASASSGARIVVELPDARIDSASAVA